MKKVTKGLIIGACAAAIAGIGTASFAAWQGASGTVTVQGTTGNITGVGCTIASCNLYGADEQYQGDDDLKLFPIDQTISNQTTDPINDTNSVNYIKITFTPNTTGGSTIASYKIKAEGDAAGALYLVADATSEPTTSTTLSGTPLSTEQTFAAGGAQFGTSGTDKVIYIGLKSDMTDAATYMNKGFTITITAVETASTPSS